MYDGEIIRKVYLFFILNKFFLTGAVQIINNFNVVLTAAFGPPHINITTATIEFKYTKC